MRDAKKLFPHFLLYLAARSTNVLKGLYLCHSVSSNNKYINAVLRTITIVVC